MRKNRTRNLFILLGTILIILYIAVYMFWVYPLYNLTTIQTKDEITDITKTLLLGKTNNSLLARYAPTPKNDISFYYLYTTIDSDRFTIWTMAHMHNKYTTDATISVYYYDRFLNKTNVEKYAFKFQDLTTSLRDGKIVAQIKDKYVLEIDENLETMQLRINLPSTKLSLKIKIDEWRTTQPSLLWRYNYLSNAQLIEMGTPGEWASDNPLIGKVIQGELNGESFTGCSWFDNFIGCNNFYLSEYYWYYIHTEDWLIYVLFYGKHENINSPEMSVPLFIKDRKNNKVLHCSPGRYPHTLGYSALHNSLFPVRVEYKESPEIKWGDPQFDRYSLYFKSNEIEINISSIPGESQLVLRHDYYGSPDSKETHAQRIKELEYIEYVNRVKLDIVYGGEKITQTVNQVIDAVVPKSRNLPEASRGAQPPTTTPAHR